MPLYRAVEKCYLNSVDGFIFNSHTTRTLVLSKLAHIKPHIVAFPAADHRQPPAHVTITDKCAKALRGDGLTQLLFVGNLMPRKGLHTLLDALAQLPSSAWHLHIVGSTEVDREYSQTMHRRASSLSIGAKTTWHGRVDDSRLSQLFSESDILVMPSYEGFGIVFLEAMAYGLPVVASRTGAAPELIQNGVNGYLIPHEDSQALANRLAFLCENPVHRATLAYFARQRFERHPTWSESMASVYQWLHEDFILSHAP
jgi:glycosyltransferase involved in cell wall biosynthesis